MKFLNKSDVFEIVSFLLGFFGMPIIAIYLFIASMFGFEFSELWNFVMYMVSIINIYNFIVISLSFYQSRVEDKFFINFSIFFINFVLSIGFLMMVDWKSGFYLLIAFIASILLINGFIKRDTTAKQLWEWKVFKS